MSGAYSRLYHALRDDEKFATVYEDDTLFAWWVRLLMDADALWPASVYIPSGCAPETIDALVTAKLLIRVNGARYKIKGLDAERERRQGQAKGAAEARWSLDPKAAQSDDPVVAYSNMTGRYPTPKAMAWLDDLASQYGSKAVIAALGKAAQAGATQGTAIGEAQNILRAEARELGQREKAAEQAKVAQRRLDGMVSRRLEWYKQTGKWDEGWGPKPE